MPRVLEMWAWVVADSGPDDEGIPSWGLFDGTQLPLIGADAERAQSLEQVAKRIAAETGKTVRLYRWGGNRELVKEVKP